jgi:hypothetical protein
MIDIKTKILRLGFWLLLGVAISTGFVACGSSDDNPGEGHHNNAFGIPGGAGQIQVVTDNVGIWLEGGSPPHTVRGTLWLISPIYPGGVPIVFTNVSPGVAVSSDSQKFQVTSFTSDASYNARIAGTITLCREDLYYNPNQQYNYAGCTPVASGFNAQLQYDQYYGTYKGKIL